MNKYARVLRAVQHMPWAILPSKLAEIVDFLWLRASGVEIDEAYIKQMVAVQAERRAQNATRPMTIGIIPVYGTITQRADFFSEWSGGTSCESISRDFNEFLMNDNVEAILFDIDSPGGTVYGVSELSDEIYKARGTKPVVAVVNSLGASAAYWLASSADEIAVTPGGEVGSIGVYAAHSDVSEFQSKAGVKTTLISAGKYKVEGNPFEPLTDEARAAIQKSVDEYYDMFISAVARNRGTSADAVRNGFGQGRVVGASEAVQIGLADRVETFKEALQSVASNTSLGTKRISSAPIEIEASMAIPVTFHVEHCPNDLLGHIDAIAKIS